MDENYSLKFTHLFSKTIYDILGALQTIKYTLSLTWEYIKA